MNTKQVAILEKVLKDLTIGSTVTAEQVELLQSLIVKKEVVATKTKEVLVDVAPVDILKCQANTKAGKQCTKKPLKNKTLCSIHSKAVAVAAPELSEKEVVEDTESVMSDEDKKREIQLLFSD